MIDRSEFIKSARLQFDDALTIIKKYCSYCRSFLLGTGNSKTVMKIHSHLSLWQFIHLNQFFFLNQSVSISFGLVSILLGRTPPQKKNYGSDNSISCNKLNSRKRRYLYNIIYDSIGIKSSHISIGIGDTVHVFVWNPTLSFHKQSVRMLPLSRMHAPCKYY